MESYLPLVDAVEKVTGMRPHFSTVIRWTRRTKQPQLQARKIGGSLRTTEEWVREFVDGGNVHVLPQSNEKASKADAEIDRLTAPKKRGRKRKTAA